MTQTTEKTIPEIAFVFLPASFHSLTPLISWIGPSSHNLGELTIY